MPTELKDWEKQINGIVYDSSQGIDTVFNKIQEYQDLCALLLNSKSDMQLITYAYLVFQKTGIFMISLKDWNNKVVKAKSFANFATIMRRQYRELKAVGVLIIQNSTLNMMQEIKNYQNQVSPNLKAEIRDGILETMQAFNMQT